MFNAGYLGFLGHAVSINERNVYKMKLQCQSRSSELEDVLTMGAFCNFVQMVLHDYKDPKEGDITQSDEKVSSIAMKICLKVKNHIEDGVLITREDVEGFRESINNCPELGGRLCSERIQSEGDRIMGVTRQQLLQGSVKTRIIFDIKTPKPGRLLEGNKKDNPVSLKIRR